MVVAFEKGLEQLKRQMRAYGFETVTYGEYYHHIDALVYSGNIDMSSVTNSYASNAGGFSGVFMVGAHGKTARDIADILNRKAYSPLF